MEQACFAAGDFKALSSRFSSVSGVVQIERGFTGGELEDPTIEDVHTHTTGHALAVLLEFDRTKTSFEILCKKFFEIHDPTTRDRQNDLSGSEYRSVIFYVNDQQKVAAETALEIAQANFALPIVTQIEPLGPFYQV
jgi:methionine-S-sulfoxide reductase